MSLKRNAIANYLGQAWVAIMGVAFVPLYIRHLGMEAWGLVGFMAMLQAWLTVLDLGLAPTLSREMARFSGGAHDATGIRDLLRTLEWLYAGIAGAVVIGVWVAAPWLASHWLNASQLSQGVMTQAIVIIALVLASRMVEQVYRGALQGLQQQVWLNRAQSLVATLRWGGGAIVVAARPEIGVFFLWQALASLLSLLWLAQRTYRELPTPERRGQWRWSAIREVWRFAAGLAITTFLSLLLTQVDKLLLSKLVTLEAFGHYTLSAAVAAMLGHVAGPMANAIYPRLSELLARGERQRLIEAYHQGCQWVAVLLIPAGLMTAFFSEPLLLAWTGDRRIAMSAAPLLAPLAIGSLCNGLMLVPYMAQLAYGMTGIAVRLSAVAVAVIVPALLWIIPRYGAVGAAWAWCLLNASYIVFGMHYMHVKLLPGEKWRWYLDALGRPLMVGGITVWVLTQVIVIPVTRLGSGVVLVASGCVVLGLTVCATPAPWQYVRRRMGFAA